LPTKLRELESEIAILWELDRAMIQYFLPLLFQVREEDVSEYRECDRAN
jgi:hypothetical protein